MFASNKAVGGGGAPRDEFFKNVVSLLHFDGTNGGQNNTFLDSSTNAFTITRNGNATQGSFSPFSRSNGYWSNYFNNSGYLNLGSNTALLPGSGDFTIEAWFNASAFNLGGGTGYQAIFSYGGGGGNARVFLAGSAPQLQFWNGSSQAISQNVNVKTGEWHHVALVRSGTTITLYLDGTSVGTVGSADNYTGTLYVGAEANGYYWSGYISNFRMVKGTALYTSSFTPPTAPLTAVANTGALTCQSNRFIDNSANNFAVTVVSNPSIQVFSPFNPTADYSTTTTGGSGYFDGSGDYLTVPDNAAFDMGTGDVTIEAWIYVTNIPSATAQGIFGNLNSGYEFYMYPYGAAGTISIGVQTFEGGYQQIYTTTNNVRLNEWTHVAFTRASGTNRFFVNGALCSTTGTLTNPLNAGGTQEIGRRSYNPTDYFYGYMSNLRIVKGTAVYTAAFTPPTAPLTAISGTSLLLNFTNASIFDNAGISIIETIGSSQLTTSQSKFGTASLILDGNTTNFARAARGAVATPDLMLGTANFTIEGFLKLDSAISLNYASYPYIWSLLRSDGINAINMFFGDAGYTNDLLWYINDGLNRTNAVTKSTFLNVWKHFAFVRSETSTFKIYVDGTAIYSGILSVDFNVPCRVLFGNYGPDQGTWGYLEEFRVTKGYARYTSNFTPPSLAFLNR